MRAAALVALVVLAGVGLVREGRAQTCSAPVPSGSCTASTTTTMTVGTVLQLSLTASATVLTPPASADYDAGFVADNGPTAMVRSNHAWTLQVSAVSGTWTATSTQPGVVARPNKPAADLQWSTGAAGPYTGMTTGGVTVGSGAATGGTATTLYFHTLYAWSIDTPGAYGLPVVFTLTAP